MERSNEVSGVRSNGTDESGVEGSMTRSEHIGALERITKTEVALGIRIREEGIEPTEHGILTVAKEAQIPLMSAHSFDMLKLVGNVSAIAVGIVYGMVLIKELDIEGMLALIPIILGGAVFAYACSKILSGVWSRHVRMAFASKKKLKGWPTAFASTLLIAAIDFGTVGYLIHSILTEDLFGLPPSTLTELASYGTSLMTTSILVLSSMLVGNEEAWRQVAETMVLDRALNVFHKEVAKAILLKKGMKFSEAQEMLIQHKP